MFAGDEYLAADDDAFGPFNDEEGDEYEDGLSDADADAMTLESAGWGTDEDYGYYGD